MNNRFKFRVWNNKYNKYEDDLYYEAGDLQVTCVNKVFEEYISDGYNIIEQCTGLKDKNGKLIYENDLVIRSLKIYRVDWCEEKLGFVLRSESNPDDTLESLDITIKTWDIIGNVHENKELLDE